MRVETHAHPVLTPHISQPCSSFPQHAITRATTIKELARAMSSKKHRAPQRFIHETLPPPNHQQKKAFGPQAPPNKDHLPIRQVTALGKGLLSVWRPRSCAFFGKHPLHFLIFCSIPFLFGTGLMARGELGYKPVLLVRFYSNQVSLNQYGRFGSGSSNVTIQRTTLK